MSARTVDATELRHDEDWEGNNAAFSCPVCRKVFIVSATIHQGQRVCPSCGRSRGYVSGGKKSGGSALIEWSDGPEQR
jgi:transcription elongation factor Elf1